MDEKINITLADIENAHRRIKPYIHDTPFLTSKTIDKMVGAEIFFKCENFQKIGAFKIRGAMNATLSLTKTELNKGLATHSSGNHAQAIAFAARQFNTRAFIVMPENSPKVKVDAVKGYGAEITFCEANQEARESALKKILNKTGATFIHPYDDYKVITGQATCAKELIEKVSDLNCLIAPVGGGGLLSGTALSTNYLLPKAYTYAAEPEGAADAILSFKSGKIEKAPYIKTIADGLLTQLSDKTLHIIRSYVKDIFLVSEQEIIEALQLIYERLKIIVEPSCAVALAAIIKNKEIFAQKKIGVILTGGNIDLSKMKEYF
jgi:threonine dehydratase